MADFQGLARLDDLQRKPFGQASRLRDNSQSGSSQYRKKAEDYNTAMRVLRREARRGDSSSALGAIRLRERANADGYSPGGIRKKSEFDADNMGRIRAAEQGAIARESATDALQRKSTEDLAPDPAETGSPATVMPESRGLAALDILEGEKAMDDPTSQRGLDSASRLGVADPTSVLRGDQNALYRRTIDSELGKASDPGAVAALRERGTRYGIKPEAFDKRAKWWERNRST